MTREGWEALVDKAAHDTEQRRLLIEVLVEQEQAKELLRECGYGCTGMGLLDTVRQALSW